MTQEELMKAELLLGKAATIAVIEILYDEGTKAVVQRLHFVADGQTNNWKMTIEKLDE